MIIAKIVSGMRRSNKRYDLLKSCLSMRLLLSGSCKRMVVTIHEVRRREMLTVPKLLNVRTNQSKKLASVKLCASSAFSPSLRLCGESCFQVHDSTQNHRRDAENAEESAE